MDDIVRRWQAASERALDEGVRILDIGGRHYATSIVAVFLVSFAFTAEVRAQDGQRIVDVTFDPVVQPLENRDLLGILPVKSRPSSRR